LHHVQFLNLAQGMSVSNSLLKNRMN
jgi:hypothetical protein